MLNLDSTAGAATRDQATVTSAGASLASVIEGVVTNQILIGRRTPLGDGVYVRQSDHAGLARINQSLLDLLPAGADALRDLLDIEILLVGGGDVIQFGG